MKCRWVHIIDSHGSSAPDEGSFTPLPNGDALETGVMPCPERGGAVTPYEEVWRELTPLAGPLWSWILQSAEEEEDGGKSFLGRIGGGYLALCEGREGFGARREEWDAQRRVWGAKYAIGDVQALPSLRTFGELVDGEEGWSVGQKVSVGARQFVVRAFEKLDV